MQRQGMMNSYGISKSSVVIFLLTLAALFLRLYVSKFHIIMVPDYDGLAYIEMAKDAADGRLFSGIWYHPFYPWLIAIAHIWIKDYQWAGMLVSILAGSFSIGILLLLAKELFGFKIGLFSALLLTLFPLHILVSTFLFTETTYSLLISLGIYFGWYTYKKRTWIYGMMTAMTMGISYLTRPEGVLIFAGIVLFLLYIAYKEMDKRLMAVILVSFITYMAVVAPYMAYLKKSIGHWVMSGKVVITNTPEMMDQKVYQRVGADLSEIDSQTLSDGIIKTPKLFMEKYKTNLLATLNSFKAELGWSILLLAVVGLLSVFFMPDQSQNRYPIVCLLITLIPVVFTPLTYSLEGRLIIPYMTAFLILSGCGIVFLEVTILNQLSPYLPRLSDIVKRYWISAVLIIVFTVSGLGYSLIYEIKEHSEEQAAVWFKMKWIGGVLNKLSTPKEVIITREPLQAFYAGRKSIGLPFGSVKDILDYAIERKASYMVIDRFIVVRKRSPLKPLLAPFYSNLDENVRRDVLGITADEADILTNRVQAVYVNEPNGIIVYKIK